MAGLQAHLNQVNAWLQHNADVRLARMPFHQVLRDTRGAAEAVRDFLQSRLDTESMAKQVDHSLYRQCTRTPTTT
jgi:RNase adaptor protein for sRNA GlmZ degradation